MNNIRGLEYHSIIEGIFGDVNGINESEQLQINCPICDNGENKHNLEINTAKNGGIFRCWSCEPKFSGSLRKLIRIFTKGGLDETKKGL